ncbi:MAG: efflux RND transporter permease subunit, partial [Myxococcales bacterium]|nr:efflux RND transporter permease subunit [Myxococcales bacterium]
MPVAFLGAIAALHASGQSMNLISTFGLLLVTGIIVDDAVVIVENVQRHLEMGKDRVQATLDGATEVFGAVVSATVTTCLAFAPLLMLEGLVGRIMRIVPIVVILSLVASLFEAFVILPGHLSHHAHEPDHEEDNLPTRLLKGAYGPLLERLVQPGVRWIALGGLTLIVAGSLSLVTLMRITLATEGHPIMAIVEVTLTPTATKDDAVDVVRTLEALAADSEPGDLVRYTRAYLGRLERPGALPRFGDRYAQVDMGFRNDKAYAPATWAFVDRLEEALARRADVVSFEVDVLTGTPPVGKAVDVRVRGPDDDSVLAAAGALTAHLEARPGLTGVRTDAGLGVDTWEVTVDPARAAAFGLREREIAVATRAAIDGAEALDLVIDGHTTPVRVRMPPPTSADALGDLPLALPGDAPDLRIRQVATVVRTQGVE